MRDEIDAAQKEGRCQGQIIAYEDAARLPFLQANIKEALRIFAPIPSKQQTPLISVSHDLAYMFLVGLPRVVPKGGIKFGDISFTEGTELSCNPYVLQTSKDLWGPDAAEYNPDRWLGPGAANLERFFCPWGAGWATCPGQHVARIQLSKMAVSSAFPMWQNALENTKRHCPGNPGEGLRFPAGGSRGGVGVQRLVLVLDTKSYRHRLMCLMQLISLLFLTDGLSM